MGQVSNKASNVHSAIKGDWMRIGGNTVQRAEETWDIDRAQVIGYCIAGTGSQLRLLGSRPRRPSSSRSANTPASSLR